MKNASVETGWLIESENRMYLQITTEAFGYPHPSFGSDHATALRFARKEDAEAFISLLPLFGMGLHEKALGAVEHQWDSVLAGDGLVS